MTWLWNLIQSEPTAFYGVIQAGLTLLCTFGLRLTIEQTGAILVFSQIVITFLTRRSVTANANLSLPAANKE